MSPPPNNAALVPPVGGGTNSPPPCVNGPGKKLWTDGQLHDRHKNNSPKDGKLKGRQEN